jgi:methyl-accepting chemotaxis protein
MSLSLRLAKSSTQVTSGAPVVVAARDLSGRDTAIAALADNQHALDEAIDALAATEGGERTASQLRETANEMRANLDRLRSAVGQRLELRDERMAMEQAIRAAGDALERKLVPLVDDTNFTLITNLQDAGDNASDTNTIAQKLSDIADKQLGEFKALLDLRADSDLALGLLTEAANVQDKDLLAPVGDRFAAAAARIGKELDSIKGSEAADALTGPVAELLHYGNAKANIFELRRRELEATTDGEVILAANRKLADTLTPLVAALVEHNERAAQDAASKTGQAIANGRVLLIGIAAASLAMALVITVLYVGRAVVRRLSVLCAAMTEVAAGNLDTTVPQNGHDEITEMAKAVVVFKNGLKQAEQLAVEQKVERDRAEADKRAALVGMADTVEEATSSALQEVSTNTGAMQTTSHQMSASASRTEASAGRAAKAAAQALANAQTVASAAEQLIASSREIGGQVSHSANVVSHAVRVGNETRSTIVALNTEVERIGAVADMIGEIAAKTNLLALNATIEAARAGVAGKGFAVVASEVKQLANQTARSTQEISQHIAQVRSATTASVEAVSRIEERITEISAIAGSITTAVEMQDAATAEIARTAAETASAAQEMATRIGEVSAEASKTDQYANEVNESAAALNKAVEQLGSSVIKVVRSSTAEMAPGTSAAVPVELAA